MSRSIDRRIKELELNLNIKDEQHVVFVCRTESGGVYFHGSPDAVLTADEFERYKAEHGVRVAIFLNLSEKQ